MIMSEQTIPIPGRLKNVAIGGHVAGSEDIDAGGGKTQKQVNDETNATLASHQSEISGLNSQNYVSVSSYSSLPATGSVDTVYRVSSWDGNANSGAGAADATKYTEYAWNGSAYIVISVKTQIGEVFDISEYKAIGGTLATFEDLSAALDNGNNVPEGIRKGGMSIKFVQSSDNKYVQYRYMGTAITGNPNPFLDINNWIKQADIKDIGEVCADILILEQGSINISGTEVNRDDRVRTKNYIDGAYTITAKSGYQVYSVVSYNGTVFDTYTNVGKQSYTTADGKRYRIVFAKENSESTLFPSELIKNTTIYDISNSINTILTTLNTKVSTADFTSLQNEVSNIEKDAFGVFKVQILPGVWDTEGDRNPIAQGWSCTEKIKSNTYIELSDNSYSPHSADIWKGDTFIIQINLRPAGAIDLLDNYDFDTIAINYFAEIETGRYDFISSGSIMSEIKTIKEEDAKYRDGSIELTMIDGYYNSDGEAITGGGFSRTDKFSYKGICLPIPKEGLPAFVNLWNKGVHIGQYAKNNLHTINFDFDEIAYTYTSATVPIGSTIIVSSKKLNSMWNGKKVNILGDSITYGAYTKQGEAGPTNTAPNQWWKIACDILSMKPNNMPYAYGISGTSISGTTSESPQQAFVNRYQDMSDDADLIIVAGGTNDYATGVPLGTINDTTDVSFYGALFVLCNGLQNKYMGKKIVFVTPILRRREMNNDAEKTKMEAFRKAIFDVARDIFGFAVIDGREMSLSCQNSVFREKYIYDGLHPNPEGHNLYGEAFAAKLSSI